MKARKVFFINTRKKEAIILFDNRSNQIDKKSKQKLIARRVKESTHFRKGDKQAHKNCGFTEDTVSDDNIDFLYFIF